MNKIRTILCNIGRKLKSAAVTFHRSIPKWLYVFPGISALCLLLHLICCISAPFADFFSSTVGALFRFLLAKITGWIPFSLGELIIILLPFALLFMIGFSIWMTRHYSAKVYCRTIAGMLSVLFSLYSLFALTLAPGYQASTLDQKMGLERKAVSADDLYSTAEILRDKVHAELDAILFRHGTFSVMPYSMDEMNGKLNDAYEAVSKKYDFIQNFRSNIKFVMLSEPMSYTHITGVYSFYTGEANLNVNFPDYSLPYTAAHELAHQRGIAREEEANFVAFLACMESDDPYIRYSGYVNVLEYVMNSLYKANSTKYYAFHGTLDYRVQYEFSAQDNFFEQYRDSVAADVSSAVNNAYLQSQGQTEGTNSYGLVVDLAVAYYKAHPVE
ncbi:MAG: DUF3810 domain-containing protein [Clostridia bacterium]|nr:DUF3810 domain-containing protein [Clostridia bacterium]